MAAALAASGHTAILSPLMSIRLDPPDSLGPGAVQALIVTSRNAVRALARSRLLPGLIGLPVFAVGPRSARDAHDLGFHGVLEGPGTAADLPAFIVANADPAGGKLVHLAGYKLAFDLEGAMTERGFQFETLHCYAAERAQALSPDAVVGITNGHLDAVLLMSPEAARSFVGLVAAHGLTENARQITCLCISQATAAALAPFQPVSTRIAGRPNSEEVLALVNRMAEQSRPCVKPLPK